MGSLTLNYIWCSTHFNKTKYFWRIVLFHWCSRGSHFFKMNISPVIPLLTLKICICIWSHNWKIVEVAVMKFSLLLNITGKNSVINPLNIDLLCTGNMEQETAALTRGFINLVAIELYLSKLYTSLSRRSEAAFEKKNNCWDTVWEMSADSK